MEKTKRRNIKRKIIYILIFIVGMGIFTYPVISNMFYEKASKSVIQNFENNIVEISSNEISDRLKMANDYNASLALWADNIDIENIFNNLKKIDTTSYGEILAINNQLGYITIPKLDVKAPIYSGTSDEVLQKGIGQLEDTSLPVGGINTHSVLVGHRGLPSAKLFTDLDHMVVGDIFHVDTMGGTLTYLVDQILIVEPDEFKDVMIVEGQDYVTLLTCTPYMINSHRLLVRGHRIENDHPMVSDISIKYMQSDTYKNLLRQGIIAVVIVLIYVFIIRKKLIHRHK